MSLHLTDNMVLAIDVYYRADAAKAVGVLFNWDDPFPLRSIDVNLDSVAEYVPGEFYKRELPCLLKVIEQVDIATLEAILVDGHVYINDVEFGLGGKLYEALHRKTPIIGVGKNAFHANSSTVKEVFRGESRKPLYVSAIGMDSTLAASNVAHMQGKYRFPDILKQLDTYTRSW